MATVAVAGYVSYHSTVNALGHNFSLPAGIAANSTAYIMVSWGGGSLTTISSGLGAWTLVDGPYNVNNSITNALYSKAVGTADSSTSFTITLTGSASAMSIAGIVTNGTTDNVSAHTSDTSLTATTTLAAFTPGAADCLAVHLFCGHHPASTTLGFTTPGTWTANVDQTTTPTTQAIPESVCLTKQLTGQNGTAQGSIALAWNATVRSNKWVLTLIPAVVGVPPTADITTVTAKQLVVTATSTTSTAVAPATITLRSWDWGDSTANTTGTAPSPHTYAADGEYTIRLTVTDSNGLTDNVPFVVQVQAAATTGGAGVAFTPSGFTRVPGSGLNIQQILNDGDPATYIQSLDNPAGQVFRFPLQGDNITAGKGMRILLGLDLFGTIPPNTGSYTVLLVEGASTVRYTSPTLTPQIDNNLTPSGMVIVDIPSNVMATVTDTDNLFAHVTLTGS